MKAVHSTQEGEEEVLLVSSSKKVKEISFNLSSCQGIRQKSNPEVKDKLLKHIKDKFGICSQRINEMAITDFETSLNEIFRTL